MKTIALLGQPNTGKSTLFNRVAGVKAHTSNLPGTTVKINKSPVRVEHEEIMLVDMPGTYSLTPLDPAQAVVLDFLMGPEVSGLIVVLDATNLARGLELFLEAAEIGIPTVIGLNMWDQLGRKGIEVDPQELSRITGVPVVPVSALKGHGIAQLMRAAVDAVNQNIKPKVPRFSKHVEILIEQLQKAPGSRFAAIKAVEGVKRYADHLDPELLRHIIEQLEDQHGEPAWEVIAAERHHLAMKTAEAVVRQITNKPSVSSRVDNIVMHPVVGSLIGLIIFGFFFWAVFKLGSWIEEITVAPLESLFASWVSPLGHGLLAAVVSGLFDGILGGIGIVLPFFIPLIFLMALLEDFGYLPRAAHLADGLMHRMGLHGKAVIPFILGYGCSVPAVAAVRTLENRWDRVLTGILVPMIPCGARTAVILGLVGYFMGFWWALFVYGLNILVVGVAGGVITRLRKGESYGMVMEIPPYRLPSVRSVGFKVWLQLREFLFVAMPLLIVGSGLMALLEFWNISGPVDAALSPFVHGLLGLPDALGSPLVFGFFRKELALVMMAQALGVSPTDAASVLNPVQMMTYTVFVSLYVPCLATVLVLWRELGAKVAWASALFSTGVAAVVAVLVRLVGFLFV